jgi:hypothetical protein
MATTPQTQTRTYSASDKPKIRLTDLLLTCTPAHHARRDAARPLPRLKMKSAEANCNGRDAVAYAEAGASAPGHLTAACQVQQKVRRRLAQFVSLVSLHG